jgi:hypothetical protein
MSFSHLSLCQRWSPQISWVNISFIDHDSSYSRTLFNPLLNFSFCILDSRSTFAFPILRCQLSSLDSIQRRCPPLQFHTLALYLLLSRQDSDWIHHRVKSPQSSILALQLRSFLVSLSSLSSFCRASVRSYTHPQFILARFNLVVLVRRKTFLSYRFNSSHPVPATFLSIHFSFLFAHYNTFLNSSLHVSLSPKSKIRFRHVAISYNHNSSLESRGIFRRTSSYILRRTLSAYASNTLATHLEDFGPHTDVPVSISVCTIIWLHESQESVPPYYCIIISLHDSWFCNPFKHFLMFHMSRSVCICQSAYIILVIHPRTVVGTPLSLVIQWSQHFSQNASEASSSVTECAMISLVYTLSHKSLDDFCTIIRLHPSLESEQAIHLQALPNAHHSLYNKSL